MTTKGDRLEHKRYKDGREKLVRYNRARAEDYKIESSWMLPGELKPIDVERLRASLGDDTALVDILDRRVKSLESLFSMEFDHTALHAAPLFVRRVKNGSRYLNEVSPCYCYSTLKEHHDARNRNGGFRASNGETSTLCMPLYLTEDHASKYRAWFQSQFSSIACINVSNHESRWHDLWVPDIVARLINHAIVDFSRGQVSEAGIQFVLDAQRLLVYCCEAPSFLSPSAAGGELAFPNMLPLMRKFLLNFVYVPQERTRDKVPDLGDMLQWLAVVELLDPSLSWKDDLVHAVVVEAMRRNARWVSKYLIEEHGEENGGGDASMTPHMIRTRTGDFDLVPHRSKDGQMYRKDRYTYRRETRSEMVLRWIRCHMSKRELLEVWWDQCQVGYRVILYSHAFYTHLFEGKTLEGFKARYDRVLGAAHPIDFETISAARAEIENVGDIRGFFRMLGYHPAPSDDDIHRLCLWSIEAQAGYEYAGRTDPFEFGWKNTAVVRKKKKKKNEMGGWRSMPSLPSSVRPTTTTAAGASSERANEYPDREASRIRHASQFMVLEESSSSSSEEEEEAGENNDERRRRRRNQECLRNRRGIVVFIPGH